MTQRQKEFCRHYVSGKSAAAAALAAGYARSTVERNAADMLAHPLCQARIAHLRLCRNIVTGDDIKECRDELMQTVRCSRDPEAKGRAIDRLCRLARLQRGIEPDSRESLITQMTQAEHAHAKAENALLEQVEQQQAAQAEALETLPATTGESPIKPDKMPPYLIDREGNIIDEEFILRPRQTDRIPTGQPAFDLSPLDVNTILRRFLKKNARKEPVPARHHTKKQPEHYAQAAE